MALMLHPTTGKLLIVGSKLATHVACCCAIDDCEDCFGPVVGASHVDAIATISVSGVTDAGCTDCENVNTSKGSLPVSQGTPIGACAIGAGTGGADTLGVKVCDDPPGFGSDVEFEFAMDYGFDGSATVSATVFIGGGVNCQKILTDEDGAAILAELCNGGTVNISIDDGNQLFCDCGSAIMTVTIAVS